MHAWGNNPLPCMRGNYSSHSPTWDCSEECGTGHKTLYHTSGKGTGYTQILGVARLVIKGEVLLRKNAVTAHSYILHTTVCGI